MIKYLIGAAVMAAGLGYLAYSGGAILALGMLVLPLFAWYASRVLVHGGFGLWHYARHGSKADWNGRHYEYAGARLRAEETEDDLVFLEDDLLMIIEQPKSKTLELFGPKERFMLAESKEMVLTQAGCERLLLKCPHRDAKKLMLFLQREAFFPYARKHGRFLPGVADRSPKTETTEERTS